jgi:hypothetical protein
VLPRLQPGDIRAANPSRRCGDRLYTDTRVTGRTLHTARRLVSASSPDPITPTEDESSRLSQRVAAPLVAPVRAAVRNAASISPRTSPVSSEDTATTYRTPSFIEPWKNFRPINPDSGSTAGMTRRNTLPCPRFMRSGS